MKKWKTTGLIFALFSLTISAGTPQKKIERPKFQKYRRINFSNTLHDSLRTGLQKETKPFVSGQVLVKFSPSLSRYWRQMALTAYQSETITIIPKLEIYQLEIPEYTSVEEMVYLMNMNPFIEYAEPNYIAHITVTPNDPLFDMQYALNNTGQAIGNIPGSPQGKENADIHAPSGWDEETGKDSVIIGFVDTGLDFDHPELKNKYVSRGKDFVNDDDDATDDHGHGTHIASIAAAETNNGIGIAGVAWNCKILPAKAMSATGSGSYAHIIEAIRYLTDNGAHIINLSIGGEADSAALEDAVKYAYTSGVVVVAASGNDSSSVLYPAAYDSYCLAVAATDYNDAHASWSNTGPQVDIAAPGERILGCVPIWYPEQVWGDFDVDPYAYGYGTSSSCPQVAGLAALIKSLKPDLSTRDIMNIIRYSADDVNQDLFPGVDDYIGYGRINIEKALRPIRITKLGK
ncbi:MAG: S8 family peptidase [Candidatus Aminicenantaceae bacterium]